MGLRDNQKERSLAVVVNVYRIVVFVVQVLVCEVVFSVVVSLAPDMNSYTIQWQWQKAVIHTLSQISKQQHCYTVTITTIMTFRTAPSSDQRP